MTVISVIGMHRSGTSCLTGSLQAAGFYVGDVVESAPFNKKGNRENLEIRSINDEVLLHNNGAWDNPPDNLSWSKELEKKRNELITKFYNQSQTWLFKDPRTTLTLPFWRDGIQELILIGVFRQPIAVAQSLVQREKINLSEAIKLWCAYNERIIAQFSENYFPLLCFDNSKNEFIRQIEKAVFWLQRKIKDKAIINSSNCNLFYDKTLINHVQISSHNEISKALYLSLFPDKKLAQKAINIYTTLLEKTRDR